MCSCKNKAKTINNNPSQKQIAVPTSSANKVKKKTREELLAELRSRISGSTR